MTCHSVCWDFSCLNLYSSLTWIVCKDVLKSGSVFYINLRLRGKRWSDVWWCLSQHLWMICPLSQATWLSFSVDQPCSSLFYFFGAKSSPLAFVALTKKLKMHSAYSKMHPFTSVHNLHFMCIIWLQYFFFLNLTG